MPLSVLSLNLDTEPVDPILHDTKFVMCSYIAKLGFSSKYYVKFIYGIAYYEDVHAFRLILEAVAESVPYSTITYKKSLSDLS